MNCEDTLLVQHELTTLDLYRNLYAECNLIERLILALYSFETIMSLSETVSCDCVTLRDALKMHYAQYALLAIVLFAHSDMLLEYY